MKRRNILRGMAAGSAISVGITPVSGEEDEDPASGKPASVDEALEKGKEGKEKHQAVQEKYNSREKIIGALEEHSLELLAHLAQEELISTTDPANLNSLSDPVGKSSKNEISISSSVDHKTDELTALVRLSEEFDGRETQIFVLPEAERSYATVEYDSGEKVLKSADDLVEEEDDDVSAECVYHDVHDWQLTGTDIECDYDDWCDYDTSCLDACAEDYYTENTYEMYECQAVDYCPGGEIPCSATTTELVNSSCSNSCCTDNGACFGSCGC